MRPGGVAVALRALLASIGKTALLMVRNGRPYRRYRHKPKGPHRGAFLVAAMATHFLV